MINNHLDYKIYEMQAKRLREMEIRIVKLEADNRMLLDIIVTWRPYVEEAAKTYNALNLGEQNE